MEPGTDDPTIDAWLASCEQGTPPVDAVPVLTPPSGSTPS